VNASPETPRPRIVVGVDGSTESRLALRWAAYLAGPAGAEIEAVTVWSYPVTYGWAAGWAYPPDVWNPKADAEKHLVATIDEVYGADRPAGLHLSTEQGYPAKVLVERSEGALMLIVGSRGLGGFSGLLLGSVSAKCAEHATCPVLVVHGDEPPPAS
jgi:nucleotide-binding universal stress UspA family protein